MSRRRRRREGRRRRSGGMTGGSGRTGASAMPPWEGSSVPGPAGSLHLRCLGDDGSRLPVLFVHGLAGHGRHWAAQVGALAAAGHPTAAPDLRGHGLSDPSGTLEYAVEHYAEDLAALVAALGWRRFLLVGHSLGAAAGIEYAARHPERVAGLALVDPIGDTSGAEPEAVAALVADVAASPHQEFAFHFRQFLADSRSEVSEAVMADLVAAPPEVLSASFSGTMEYPVARRLRASRVPVAFLVSTLNRGPESLPALFPDAPVARVVRAGHWIMLDRPELVSRFAAEWAAAWGPS